MSDSKKISVQKSQTVINKDKGLTPVSSGTPMPKVKPAKPATPPSASSKTPNKKS